MASRPVRQCRRRGRRALVLSVSVRAPQPWPSGGSLASASSVSVRAPQPPPWTTHAESHSASPRGPCSRKAGALKGLVFRGSRVDACVRHVLQRSPLRVARSSATLASVRVSKRVTLRARTRACASACCSVRAPCLRSRPTSYGRPSHQRRKSCTLSSTASWDMPSGHPHEGSAARAQSRGGAGLLQTAHVMSCGKNGSAEQHP